MKLIKVATITTHIPLGLALAVGALHLRERHICYVSFLLFREELGYCMQVPFVFGRESPAAFEDHHQPTLCTAFVME